MSRPQHASLTLAEGMSLSAMSFEELWLRVLSVGGDTGRVEIEAYVLGLLAPDRFTHNVIAQAINEHFIDEAKDHPVRYADDTG